MANIFVSYSQANRERVRPIVDELGAQGFKVWWDPEGAAGEDLDEMVLREIGEASCVIVAWSTAAVESDWVKGEAEEARKQKKLISINIDDAELPLRFGHGVRPDLSRWDGDAGDPEFQKLLKGVGAFVAPSTGKEQQHVERRNKTSAGSSRLWLPAAAVVVAGVVAIVMWPDSKPEPEDLTPTLPQPVAPQAPAYTLSISEIHLEDCQGRAPAGGKDDICLAIVRNDAFGSIEKVFGCEGARYVCGKEWGSDDEHRINLNIDLQPGKNSFLAYEEDWDDGEMENYSVCLERGPLNADNSCLEMGRIDFHVDGDVRIMPGSFRLLSQAKQIEPVDIEVETGRVYETIFHRVHEGRYRILWNLEMGTKENL